MREVLTSEQCEKLVSLWRNRERLCQQDVGCMYHIVELALHGYNPPELQALGEGREELIAQFIYSKVLRLDSEVDKVHRLNASTDDGHSAPSSSYALCAYFRRYLIDCTRSSAFRRRVSIADDVMDNHADELGEHADDLAGRLEEHGLCVAGVSRAAKKFINDLPEPEKILLCESFGKEAAGGLSGVAARYSIASYHYRAGRLGLVHKRENLPTDYAKTTLGCWIQDTLGIPIEGENMGAVLSVLQILGVEASYA